jgi:glucuronate isomerase
LTSVSRHENLDAVDRLADVVARIGAGSPLVALAAARDLATVAGEAMQQAVDQARAAGHSWREIGDVLGTTRQAAFQRFGHPVDPRTGAPMSTVIAAGAVDRAVTILASMAEGQWEEARRDFNAQMTQRLDASLLADGWARMVGLVGAYEGMGEPFAHRVGDHTVVEIPLRFEAGEATGRVVFDEEGKVAGLWLRP